jgi:uncharacterized protein (DUF1684 family)
MADTGGGASGAPPVSLFAMSEHLDLADWRRQVAGLYDTMRRDRRAAQLRLVAFRAGKDRLFAEHPSSPVPEGGRRSFPGLAYWRHDASLRFTTALEPDPEAAAPAPEVPRSGAGPAMPFNRIGWISFEVAGSACRLAVYWLNEYSGGIFIPFRDGTSGAETYGGGRYLWDSAKGADLGSSDGELVIDFNYAYHPSCVYDPLWSCPLAPQENWLPVAIPAGERLTPAP